MHDKGIVCLRLVVLALCAVAGVLATSAQADIRLPAIIGDNMVIQAGDRVRLWGWADPNEAIEVAISWRDFTWGVQADGEGKWEFQMVAPNVGGPYQIMLRGKNTVTIRNILCGQVWVCSGQSNMQWPVQRSMNAEQEIAAAKYPKIRLFTVERRVMETPQDDCKGQWVECSPETVGDFTAVGYFFGRELYKELKQPIGLIHTSWGGTPAEAWMSMRRLKENPNFAPIVTRYEQAVAVYPEALAKYKEDLAKWDEAAAKAKAEGQPAPGGRPNPPMGPGHYQSPAGLYNAMIAPLLSYTIAGAIWYQGESNAGRAYQYRTLFPSMIKCWWDDWRQGDFPFIFVQLANFMEVKDAPGDSAWAELREAQSMTLDMPNTGMAVAIDIGEAKDIHPKNKQDVGKRLALWALANTYSVDVDYSGPLYQSMEKNGNKIVLHFEHCDGGLIAKGGEPLKGFAVAGEDRKFVWADARIVDDTVVVSSEQVPEPMAVRYAWADNPVCNLFNKAGLPASPFRTDIWPGVTVNNK